MGEYILQTNNLCKNFRGQCAVNDISITVKTNSIYGMLGPKRRR